MYGQQSGGAPYGQPGPAYGAQQSRHAAQPQYGSINPPGSLSATPAAGTNMFMGSGAVPQQYTGPQYGAQQFGSAKIQQPFAGSSVNTAETGRAGVTYSAQPATFNRVMPGLPPHQLNLPASPRVVCFPNGTSAHIMPMGTLRIIVEIHVSVAFIRVVGTWKSTFGGEADCVFELPTPQRGTVTSASIDVVGASDHKAYDTTVVDRQALARAMKAKKVTENAGSDILEQYLASMGGSYGNGEYDPDVFRLPFRSSCDAMVQVDVSYFQDLKYADGSYSLTIPLRFADHCVLDSVGNSVGIYLELNTGTDKCKHNGASHPLAVVEQSGNRTVMQSNLPPNVDNMDFNISFAVWSPGIISNLLVQPKPDGSGGNFCLFLAPPEKQNAQLPMFPRRLVFIVDNSGSMMGMPMDKAIQALLDCLDMLMPHDEFAICVFHENQQWWSPYGGNTSGRMGDYGGVDAGIGSGRANVSAPSMSCMVRATPGNVQRGKDFARSITAGGLTDILHPVQQAFGLLQEVAAHSPSPAVPFVFLITDGAVPDEREVCKYVKDTPLPCRIFTLGIGTMCNTYFLRMLAQIGRGYSDMSLRGETLREDIVGLMSRMSVPVLLDVTPGMQVASAQIYPSPIPDLFVGSPVVVSGEYTGEFPASITVRGRMPPMEPGAAAALANGGRTAPMQDGSGVYFEQVVATQLTRTIPLDKVFVKTRLDLMIASDWLAGAEPKSQLRKEVVALSEESSMPCPYTTMVLGQVDRPKPQIGGPLKPFRAPGYGEAKAQQGSGAGAGAGQQGSDGKLKAVHVAAKPRPKGGNIGLVVAASAAAGVCVLGAGVGAAVAFGSLSGTAAGLSGLAAGTFGGFSLTDIDVGMPDCGCCDSIPCVPEGVGASCGACWGQHEGALDVCFGNCGDSMSECTGAIGGAFAGCGAGCGECGGSFYNVLCKCSPSGEPPDACADCGPCSGIAAGCGDMAGGVGAFCGSCFGGIASGAGAVCNTCGDCASGCCSSYSEFFSSCKCECDGVGGVCAAIGGCIGGIGGCLGGCVEGIGSCFGDACGCIGDIFGCLGDTCGELCELNK